MNKKKIERYLIEDRRYQNNIRGICPFHVENFLISKDKCLNRYCGKVFTGWRRKMLNCQLDFLCPCYALDITYVKRRFRKWLKE